MNKAVLFELDNCLVWTQDLYYHALNKAYKKIYNTYLKEEYNQNLSVYDNLNHIARDLKISDNEKKYLLSLTKWNCIEYTNKEIKPDNVKIKMLEWLQNQGFYVGVLTNTHRHVAEILLHQSLLFNNLSFLLCYDDDQVVKPHKSMYVTAMNNLCCGKDKIVSIESQDIGMQAASNAGIQKAYLVKYNEVSLGNLQKILK